MKRLWCVSTCLLLLLGAGVQAQIDLGATGEPLPSLLVDLVASVNGEVVACPQWLLDGLRIHDKTVCSRFSSRPAHRESLDQLLQLRNPLEVIGWELDTGHAYKVFVWSAAPNHGFAITIHMFHDLLASSLLSVTWSWERL